MESTTTPCDGWIPTEEQLKEIEHLAGLFYSISEIALILEVPHRHLHDMIGSASPNPVKRAYHRGWSLSEAQIRSAEVMLAKQGSTPAQQTVREIMQKAQRSNGEL
jgi:hypothetical protein